MMVSASMPERTSRGLTGSYYPERSGGYPCRHGWLASQRPLPASRRHTGGRVVNCPASGSFSRSWWLTVAVPVERRKRGNY